MCRENTGVDGMNQVNVFGTIGNEPQAKSFQSDKPIAGFSAAINATA